MKTQNFSDDFLTAAARLCYIDKIPQQEVARMLNVSQAKVSRLLNLARQRGIVQISVKEYEPRNAILENNLKKAFGLKDVIVMKVLGETYENSVQRVGYFGGKQLMEYLKPGMRVGVAGGRTIMYAVDGFLSMEMPGDLTVVQLMGNVGSTPAKSDASELGRRLTAESGTFMALNAPIFIKDEVFKQSLLMHDQIKSVMDTYYGLDIAFVGVGTPENSIFASLKAISPQQIDELKNEGIVGEVCGHFFDRNGSELDTKFRGQVVSIDIECLRKIPKVFAVVCGKDRAEAIAGAIRGRFINSLLIDESGAENLLQFI
jgi:DNA-binding transcriptional regulator LsrR (DeoR family)